MDGCWFLRHIRKIFLRAAFRIDIAQSLQNALNNLQLYNQQK